MLLVWLICPMFGAPASSDYYKEASHYEVSAPICCFVPFVFPSPLQFLRSGSSALPLLLILQSSLVSFFILFLSRLRIVWLFPLKEPLALWACRVIFDASNRRRPSVH